LIDHWEVEIDHPMIRGPLNLAQVTLICALGLEPRNPTFRWREGHPMLRDWFDRMAARPSVARTVPSEGH
jgi:glutathione S-transferase